MKAPDTGGNLASELEADERDGSAGKQDEYRSDCEGQSPRQSVRGSALWSNSQYLSS